MLAFLFQDPPGFSVGGAREAKPQAEGSRSSSSTCALALREGCVGHTRGTREGTEWPLALP